MEDEERRRIDRLETEVSGLRSDIDDIKSDLRRSQNNDEVARLRMRVDKLETEIEDLKRDLRLNRYSI